jgi:ribosomal protein S18 acetylase RimI-like enzyme
MAQTEQFEVRYGYDAAWLDKAIEIYNKTEMKRTNSEKVGRAFSNSQVVVSVWLNDRLVSVGRMITDFEMYSSIFDVVVDPDFQKKGLGQAVMKALIEKVPKTCIYLTSTFGNEAFYHKLGFRFHKSAMALYPESFGRTPYLEWDRTPLEAK